MGRVFHPHLVVFEFLEGDQQSEESHGLLVAADEVEIKGIGLVVFGPNDHQSLDIIRQSVHLADYLFVCWLIDGMGQAFTLLYPVQAHQLEKAEVFVRLAESQTSELAVADRAFECSLVVDDQRDASLAEGMPAHEHPRAFVSFVEVLHADSALEVISDVLGFHPLAGYKKMRKVISSLPLLVQQK